MAKRKLTAKQIEKLVDMVALWATGCLGAGAADAFFGEGRIWLDIGAGCLGFSLAVVAVWLTGKLDGDRM